ncbi:hypothetical protein NK718_13500 [Alsobacter sp. SYSU M60028]|uniref:Uncharacterized protein n=1 Tax=Alsobacter ponti TaxID=2962936 RepID=A0ABT1LEJ9_9HYPH|nr:hypothetical protein [Alsobacter ponti]MCP8939536.1 hypothetical protein [Alsobacter ponti]
MTPRPDPAAALSALVPASCLAAACLAPGRAAAALRAGGGPAARLAALASDTRFGRPIRRAVAMSDAGFGLGIDKVDLSLLAGSPEGAVVLRFVCQEGPGAATVRRQLAAALLHERLRRLVSRADRERARAVLGDALFVAASHGAALARRTVGHDFLSGIDDPLATSDIDEAMSRMDGLGVCAMADIVAGVEPALTPLMTTGNALARPVRPASHPVCAAVARFIERTCPPWPASTS